MKFCRAGPQGLPHAVLPLALALATGAMAGAAAIAKAHAKPKGFDRLLRDVSAASVDRLRAEIAAAEGRYDEALQLQAQAVVASKEADDNEPPMPGPAPG